jgi:hypothetical protein
VLFVERHGATVPCRSRPRRKDIERPLAANAICEGSVRIANELAQAGEYGGVAIKVLDEQGNEVAYVPIGKRSD